MNLTFYDSVAVKPNSICFFRKPEYYIGGNIMSETSLINLEDNRHMGLISKKVGKKMNTAIDWLIEIAKEKTFRTYKNKRQYKFKINFITLTLPSKQVHSDTDIKNKLLNQLLIEAKRKWQIKNYIWKAEPQKNGNIHFHLTTDQFIPHTELRDTWNRIINKLGYVENYSDIMKQWHKDGFRLRKDLVNNWNISAQKKAYQRGMASDWISPNSTDIHSVKNIGNLSAYLKKYYTKNDTGRAIEGRLWGISQALGKMKSVIFELDLLSAWNFEDFTKKYGDKIKYSTFFGILFEPWAELSIYFDSVTKYLFDEYIDYFRITPIPT